MKAQREETASEHIGKSYRKGQASTMKRRPHDALSLRVPSTELEVLRPRYSSTNRCKVYSTHQMRPASPPPAQWACRQASSLRSKQQGQH